MEPNAPDGFGVMLRLHRRAAGLTQEELATAAGVSVRAIRDTERGASQPRGKSVARLADALGLAGAGRDEFTRAASGAAGDGSPAPGRGEQAAQRGPWQLPGAAADFTGRSAELKTLTGLLDQGERPPGTVLITAIDGTAGVGKTALAVHWARQITGRFPDGQLYVNLRGYDPGQPLPPTDALAGFLRALGVPGQGIPADTEERAARYRGLLAGRRMLVLLDNAASAEQVRPLLPATPDCVAVVTSRDTLAGLVARDGARRLDLDLLSPADAAVLLTTLIGDRAAADPAATAALATACARLPLALRIAAEFAATRLNVSLADLTAELTDEHRRLDLLEAGGDRYTAVRAVFSWSYRHLDPDTARTFRLAGLHPRPDFEAYAAAALTGTTLDHTQHLLGALARANLTHLTTPGHYNQHDLLRDYACELAAGHEGPDGSRAALTRLFDHYLHTAGVAMDALFPAERHRRPAVPAAASPVPPVTEPTAAQDWLDTHRATLITVAAHMAEHGWPGHTARLAATLARYLNRDGYFTEGVAIHTCACHAARRTGDRGGEATALNNLGLAFWSVNRIDEAAAAFERSLALFHAAGDRGGAAKAVGNLGLVEQSEGLRDQAADHYRQAIDLFRETGDRTGEARVLSNLGSVTARLGRYGEAAIHQERALNLFRETGERGGEGLALTRFGSLEQQQGHYQEAAERYREALTLYREYGGRTGEALALCQLGEIGLMLGRYQQAVEDFQQALVLYREFGDASTRARVLNGLGQASLATGRAGDARARYDAGLALASEASSTMEQARAHNGLGHTHLALGDPGQARRHWQEALARYTGLGVPEADHVRTQLAGLGRPAQSEQAQ
jgi:tetratricopeptide (TPR) repeat protein/transcriptional regulator with XRE-family HTH domain